jgi:hypothetical protein
MSETKTWQNPLITSSCPPRSFDDVNDIARMVETQPDATAVQVGDGASPIAEEGTAQLPAPNLAAQLQIDASSTLLLPTIDCVKHNADLLTAK